MDEILSKYFILIIFLIAAALCDIVFLGVPMWLCLFAFGGRMISGPDILQSLALAGGFCLLVFFIDEILSRIKGFCVLGMGDIYIIFIIGLYLNFEAYLTAIFISCLFALIMALIFCRIMRFCEFPLAPAFLFGTLAAIW